MDRNSAIGLTLIAVLLLVYFNFLAPTPPMPDASPAQVTTPVTEGDTLTATTETSLPSGDVLQQYGSLSTALTGNESLTTVENADLRVQLSNQGFIKEVELKKFKTYSQTPLYLAQGGNNRFSLQATYEGKEIDLYKLFYSVSTSKKNDTTHISLTANTGGTGYVKHIYSIPPAGYQIGYHIQTSGIVLGGKNLTYRWNDQVPLQEKAIADSRTKTTINYYTVQGEFDNLSQTSNDLETEALATPLKWVSIRQKFFISAILARNSFSGGEVKTVANVNDPAIVKEATVELYIPTEDVSTHKASFAYYFGPNDYNLLSDVAEGFSRNLDLGWPPMLWINKFVIIPIFNFLEGFVSSYGLIIVLLVLFVKILLLPLSYKSYLGMAKMKLLKPELDLIKEKNGDNMTQNQQDQMKLYQQAGVNPFSGCIPLLLQMPILFAMFYFFPVSIELRQKSFLWAEDLSTYDSIINLPFTIPFYGSHVSLFVLLMTASTLIYQWQNNQLSNVQGPMKTMGMIMPVIFMFVLNSFSAGLSFYYFVSNLVTFAQQAIIKRFVDEDKIMAVMEDHKKKMLAGGGTGKKSSFMSKLEQAMKASEEARKASKKK
ncbi:MAG: membrane protein insertase YidC [Cyclobacteriaceae bacterium]|nr:membrane protein insertase YidC [Cyclobacteriaceae bacterium]